MERDSRNGMLKSAIVALIVCVCAAAVADDWPQWRGPERDGVWRESGIVEKFSGPKLEPKWRQKISSGYCGPTVAKGRVYVADRIAEPGQLERVHCFDEQTGAPVWSHEYECRYKVPYPAGPRASIAVDDGRAYLLGTMGHLHCYDAKSGAVLWRKLPGADYDVKVPQWGAAAAPIIEKDLVIVMLGAQPNACWIGLDRQTGAERWRALSDPASYSAPTIIELAGRRVLIGWTGLRVVILDPASGKLLSEHPFKPSKWIDNIMTPVYEPPHLFFTMFYDGSLLLKLDPETLALEKVWHVLGPSEKETQALHACMTTPVILGDEIYGVDSYGEFRCLDRSTGARLWTSQELVPYGRNANIHLIQHGAETWLFNEAGELIITRLTREGVEQLSRAQLIQPTTVQYKRGGKGVTWSHPAFANKCVFIRNDEELLCVDLSAKGQ